MGSAAKAAGCPRSESLVRRCPDDREPTGSTDIGLPPVLLQAVKAVADVGSWIGGEAGLG